MAVTDSAKEETNHGIVTLGLDLGKNWVHMVGFDQDGGKCCADGCDGASCWE